MNIVRPIPLEDIRKEALQFADSLKYKTLEEILKIVSEYYYAYEVEKACFENFKNDPNANKIQLPKIVIKKKK